ncbi:unnamed protein product [Caretta caretta]
MLTFQVLKERRDCAASSSLPTPGCSQQGSVCRELGAEITRITFICLNAVWIFKFVTSVAMNLSSSQH